MGTEFRDFYDHVFKALIADTNITDDVVQKNIRPGNDPIESEEGKVITYDWTSGNFDDAQKKGFGTFAILVSVPENKTVATELLDKVRTALTAKTLTAADIKVRVSKFKQNDALSDDEVSEAGRFQASVTYDVRFVSAA